MMSKQSIKNDFTIGFSYSVKNNQMNLSYICDCCGKEIIISKKIPTTCNYHPIFELLKEDMDGKFHHCEKCGFLICPTCWEEKDEKCPSCKVCLQKH